MNAPRTKESGTGLYGKYFGLRRTRDESEVEGWYFVIREFDRAGWVALEAYADACESYEPELAQHLRQHVKDERMRQSDPTKESGRQENIEWAYDVVGAGMTIRTLCDLKAERDALREALRVLEDCPFRLLPRGSDATQWLRERANAINAVHALERPE